MVLPAPQPCQSWAYGTTILLGTPNVAAAPGISDLPVGSSTVPFGWCNSRDTALAGGGRGGTGGEGGGLQTDSCVVFPSGTGVFSLMHFEL